MKEIWQWYFSCISTDYFTVCWFTFMLLRTQVVGTTSLKCMGLSETSAGNAGWHLHSNVGDPGSEDLWSGGICWGKTTNAWCFMAFRATSELPHLVKGSIACGKLVVENPRSHVITNPFCRGSWGSVKGLQSWNSAKVKIKRHPKGVSTW